MPHIRFPLCFSIILTMLINCTSVVAFSVATDLLLHTAIMRSTMGFEGRVVSTIPFSPAEWERESLVVVDRPVFGIVALGDTLRIRWRSNFVFRDDGMWWQVACGGETQLSEIEGEPALWLVAGDEPFTQSLSPVVLSEYSRERLGELAAIAEAGPTSGPLSDIELLDEDELKQDPKNLAKCEKVAAFLRESAVGD